MPEASTDNIHHVIIVSGVHSWQWQSAGVTPYRVGADRYQQPLTWHCYCCSVHHCFSS